MKGAGYVTLTLLQNELQLITDRMTLLRAKHGFEIVDVYPFYQDTIKTLQQVAQYNQDCWNTVVDGDVSVLDNKVRGINLHREMIDTRFEQFKIHDEQMALKEKIDASSKDFNMAMTVVVGSVIGLIIIAVVSGL